MRTQHYVSSVYDALVHYLNASPANGFELRISQTQQGPNIGRYALQWFNINDFSIATKVQYFETLAHAVLQRENDGKHLLQHGYTQHTDEQTPSSEMNAPTP